MKKTPKKKAAKKKPSRREPPPQGLWERLGGALAGMAEHYVKERQEARKGLEVPLEKQHLSCGYCGLLGESWVHAPTGYFTLPAGWLASRNAEFQIRPEFCSEKCLKAYLKSDQLFV